MAAAAVGHAIASWGLAAAWIAPDEPTYGMLGRSLWHTGRLTILGDQGSFYGIVYPAFVGLPLDALGSVDGIKALQIAQPLVMSAAGLVVYAWARRLVAPKRALVATALTLAVPAFLYSGLLMTEIAYYPIATVALLAMARALEQPTLERQAVAVSAILLAALTRLQALALLPALITAIALAALFERNLRLLRRFAVTLILLTVAGAVVVGIHESGTSRDLLGAYTTTAHTSYELGPALRWIVFHAGDVFLLVAGVPLLATLVLAVDACRGRERSPAARALLAVTVSYVLWSILQVGVFASRFSGVLLERNLITVAPPLFVAFALWLERGAPRPQPATTALCAIAVAPALVLPVARLTDPYAAPHTFTSLSLTHVLEWTSAGWTRVVWIAGVAAVTALFLTVPRRAVWVLPVVALSLLAGASAVAATDVHRLASDLRRGFNGDADRRWVDHAAAGPVTYVYGGSQYWNAVWIAAFWNTRIDHVAALAGPEPDSLPPNEVVSPRFDGRLFASGGGAVDDPYVLASERYVFVGEPVRAVTRPIDGSTTTLWKVDPPARLRMLRTGFKANGDFSGHAQIDVFSCGPGELQVTFLGKDGSPVTLSAPGVEPRTVAPTPGIGSYVTIPAPPSGYGGRCSFFLETPGLVGTTVTSFAPASA